MMVHSRIDARGVLVDFDGTVYESGAAMWIAELQSNRRLDQ